MALIGQGLNLMARDRKLYVFGLVVGALSVIQVGFMDREMVGLTPYSSEAEVAAALGSLTTMALVFGFLFVFAYAALWTYAVRSVQGSLSVEDTVDRVRRRVWAVLFYSPVMFLVLLLPGIPLSVFAAALGPTNVIVLSLLLAWLIALVVIVVGMWGVVPSYTISDVRFGQMFRVTLRGVQNGGLRAGGLFVTFAVASMVVSLVFNFSFPDAPPFGLVAVLQIPIFGYLSAWLAAAIAHLWVAEAENIVVGLPSTSGDAIVESNIVYEHQVM